MNIKQKNVNLDDFKGKLIILNFWATWCAPCKEEMPSLDELQSNIELNNLKIFTINIVQEDISKSELLFNENISLNTEEVNFTWKDLNNMVSPWAERFDNSEGGSNGAPKFPMPNAYSFLLKYGHLANNKQVLDHVELTLDKMAFGGIYDQMGGGFSRYSVDKSWKAPHLEKRL